MSIFITGVMLFILLIAKIRLMWTKIPMIEGGLFVQFVKRLDLNDPNQTERDFRKNMAEKKTRINGKR